jgi:hypothetical protein
VEAENDSFLESLSPAPPETHPERG